MPDEPETRFVHGDVTAGNILVDQDLRPVTLLDFGLSTMAAEAAFEAFVERLGYDAVRLLVYRCAYSILIANAHDVDPYGRDSHLPLTAKLFNSPEITALLTR